MPDLAKVQFTLETNLFGAWRCAIEAIPVMRARGYGRIVNLSSTLASLELTQHTPGSPAYRVSKAGLNMLTRVLAAEVEHDGILVNAASPGYTRTDMSPDSRPPGRPGGRHRGLGRPRCTTSVTHRRVLRPSGGVLAW